MSVDIVSAVSPQPPSIDPGEQAELVVTLRSDQPPETATLAYTVTHQDYTFGNGSKQLVDQAVINPQREVRTPFSLAGPAGPAAVNIDLEVTPGNPPSRSGTNVTIKSRMKLRAARRKRAHQS